jgi:hypothetical protein
MAASDPILLSIAVALLLTSSAATEQTLPELQPFRGAWVPEGAKCDSIFLPTGYLDCIPSLRCNDAGEY